MTSDLYREQAERRRSLRFIEEISEEKEIEEQGHAFLLIRDLPLGILPLSTSPKTEGFSVTTEPDSADAREWLIGLLGSSRSYREELASVYVDFVEEVAHDLAAQGQARYEIVPADARPAEPGSGSSTDGRRPTMLLRVQPGRLVRLPRSYLQLIPKGASTESGRRHARIPAACMWRFTLPPQFGSPGRQRRLIKKLAALKQSVPSFTLDKGFEALSTPGYELGAFSRAFELRSEALLRDWGTVMSMPQLKHTSEYFYIRRRIQWHHSQALVSEQILRDLNRLLDERLRAGVRVEVNGVPSAAEIAEAGARLDRGEIGFTAAMEKVGV